VCVNFSFSVIAPPAGLDALCEPADRFTFGIQAGFSAGV
jgi:hypothetical protein